MVWEIEVHQLNNTNRDTTQKRRTDESLYVYKIHVNKTCTLLEKDEHSKDFLKPLPKIWSEIPYKLINKFLSL
jgi:hypothetical protein